MDITLKCKDVNISGSYSNDIEIECSGVDSDFLDDKELINQIGHSDYISHLDTTEKDNLLIELLDHVDLELVLMQYDKEQILENFDLDEILDYFKDNLINHV